MVVIKFQYGNDVRRITRPAEELAYEELIRLIELLYNQLGPGGYALPEEFKLKYVDEENDFVGLTCDNELRDALAQLPEGKVLRVMIVDAAPNPAPSAMGASISLTDHVHNVVCRHCGHQVQGVRYVCVNCTVDYSLCSGCERKRLHDSQHLFLKVYAPLPPDALSQVLPLPNLYAPSAEGAQSCPNWIRQRKSSVDGAPRGRAACYNNKGAGSRRERSLNANKLACRFVEDITVDDGRRMPPGSLFVKIWRLRNSGTTAWPEGVTLSFVSGDSLSPYDSVPVMSISPGAEVDVSVDMVAPMEAGRYVSNWRLRSPSGVFFGHQVWADIMVSHQADEVESSSSCPVRSAERDDDDDAEESEWELGRSKVRKIVKVIRRSHSDIESEDDGDDHIYAEAEAEADTDADAEDEEEPQLPNIATAQSQENDTENENETEEKSADDDEEEEVEEVVEGKPSQSPTSEDDEWEVVPTEEWADELAALQEMSLGDLAAIRKALKEANGNVQLAAQKLLGE